MPKIDGYQLALIVPTDDSPVDGFAIGAPPFSSDEAKRAARDSAVIISILFILLAIAVTKIASKTPVMGALLAAGAAVSVFSLGRLVAIHPVQLVETSLLIGGVAMAKTFGEHDLVQAAAAAIPMWVFASLGRGMYQLHQAYYLLLDTGVGAVVQLYFADFSQAVRALSPYMLTFCLTTINKYSTVGPVFMPIPQSWALGLVRLFSGVGGKLFWLAAAVALSGAIAASLMPGLDSAATLQAAAMMALLHVADQAARPIMSAAEDTLLMITGGEEQVINYVSFTVTATAHDWLLVLATLWIAARRPKARRALGY